VNYKTCPRCGERMQATNDNFSRQKGGKFGLQAKCKLCKRLEAVERYNQEIEKQRIRAREKYHINKNAIQKYRENNRDSILEYHRNRYRKYKEEINLKHKVYRENNKEREQKRHKSYGQTEEGKAKIRVKGERRRSRKAGLPHSFTISDWEKCQKYFDFACCYCGKEQGPLTQDHFIPIDNKGGYTPNNIVPCCQTCNSSKCNKNFYEWYRSQDFYNEVREKKIIKYLREMVLKCQGV